jgi:class 3 adenylate cyclase
MNVLKRIFKSHEKFSKKANCSIISISFVNLDTLVDLHEPLEIIEHYKLGLKKILYSVKKLGCHVGVLIGNYLLLVVLEEENENHAETAYKAAIIVQEHIRELNSYNIKKGLQKYKSVIGIHTGEILVSNEVQNPSSDIIALGENINVCKKIMEQCEVEKNEILISETTVQAIDKKDIFIQKKTLDINLPNLYPNSNSLAIYKNVENR